MNKFLQFVLVGVFSSYLVPAQANTIKLTFSDPIVATDPSVKLTFTPGVTSVDPKPTSKESIYRFPKEDDTDKDGGISADEKAAGIAKKLKADVPEINNVTVMENMVLFEKRAKKDTFQFAIRRGVNEEEDVVSFPELDKKENVNEKGPKLGFRFDDEFEMGDTIRYGFFSDLGDFIFDKLIMSSISGLDLTSSIFDDFGTEFTTLNSLGFSKTFMEDGFVTVEVLDSAFDLTPSVVFGKISDNGVATARATMTAPVPLPAASYLLLAGIAAMAPFDRRCKKVARRRV